MVYALKLGLSSVVGFGEMSCPGEPSGERLKNGSDTSQAGSVQDHGTPGNENPGSPATQVNPADGQLLKQSPLLGHPEDHADPRSQGKTHPRIGQDGRRNQVPPSVKGEPGRAWRSTPPSPFLAVPHPAPADSSPVARVQEGLGLPIKTRQVRQWK